MKIADQTVANRPDVASPRKLPLSHMSIHGSPAGKYLPVKIKEFRPNPSHTVDPIPLGSVQEKIRVWVSSCRVSVETNIPSWLGLLLTLPFCFRTSLKKCSCHFSGYVDNVKSLATIRQAAYDVIAEDPYGSSWDEVSAPLLPEENRFRRWEDLFLPSFMARVCLIIDARLSQLSQDLVSRAKGFFAAIEQDRYDLRCSEILALSTEQASTKMIVFPSTNDWNLCPYIWSESSGDLPEGDGWVRPATSFHVDLESGGTFTSVLGSSFT